jgi:SAM-dependent methyltransferase
MTDQAAEFVGSIPEHYDRGLGPIVFDGFAADMADRVTAAASTNVLEIAAGTGIVTRHLRDRLAADAQLTATDLNAPMLEVARARFQPGERVTFQPADALALPFPDGVFDTVVCQFGVMFFPDKDKAYREVRRVLGAGGRYLFSVWDAHRYNPFGRIAQETIAGFFPVDPPQFYQVPFGYHAIDPIKEALIDAGFADIKIAVLGRVREIPDVGAFARGLVYGNPVIDQIRARGGEPDGIVAAVAQALRRELGADSARMPVQAIVFSARRR